MGKRSLFVMLAVVFLLGAAGGAGAQTGQTLLPGALIPKFVDPLPVATTPTVPGITVVDATGGTTPPTYVPYNITMSEFKAQIPARECPQTRRQGF